jgi:hypothetical protein
VLLLEIDSEALAFVLVFITVTGCAPDDAPTSTVLKSNDPGLTVITAGAALDDCDWLWACAPGATKASTPASTSATNKA